MDLEFNGLPSSKKSLKKHNVKELHKYMQDLAKQANARIKAINKRGIRELSPTYTRKYDPMLYGNTIDNIGTKKGFFSSARTTKSNMIDRIQKLEGFMRNPYTSVERSEAYVKNLLQQTGLDSEADLKELFNVYRDFGYDDYKDDSDKIIEIFSEMMNKGYEIRRVASFLEENRINFRDQQEEIDKLEQLSNSVDFYRQMEDKLRPGNDTSQDTLLNSVLTMYRRRGI